MYALKVWFLAVRGGKAGDNKSGVSIVSRLARNIPGKSDYFFADGQPSLICLRRKREPFGYSGSGIDTGINWMYLRTGARVSGDISW